MLEGWNRARVGAVSAVELGLHGSLSMRYTGVPGCQHTCEQLPESSQRSNVVVPFVLYCTNSLRMALNSKDKRVKSFQ